MTYAEAVAKAVADFAAAVGTTRQVESVYGMGPMLEEWHHGPFTVRILPTSPDDLRHCVDSWLDPYWNVEVISGGDGRSGAGSGWIYGDSYQFEGVV